MSRNPYKVGRWSVVFQTGSVLLTLGPKSSALELDPLCIIVYYSNIWYIIVYYGILS